MLMDGAALSIVFKLYPKILLLERNLVASGHGLIVRPSVREVLCIAFVLSAIAENAERLNQREGTSTNRVLSTFMISCGELLRQICQQYGGARVIRLLRCRC